MFDRHVVSISHSVYWDSVIASLYGSFHCYLAESAFPVQDSNYVPTRKGFTRDYVCTVWL